MKKRLRLGWFQHTAARRRLAVTAELDDKGKLFQHTAARRRLEKTGESNCCHMAFQHTAARRRLEAAKLSPEKNNQFQHTAARRRLDGSPLVCLEAVQVSTHSRPKAAGQGFHKLQIVRFVSTHSRPKAAGRMTSFLFSGVSLFQHTAARRRLGPIRVAFYRASSFNTQPPEGGWLDTMPINS